MRALRSPYLDLREGPAAGAAQDHLPGRALTALLAVAWPLVGLVPAYNLALALSSVATGLAAFAWLPPHPLAAPGRGRRPRPRLHPNRMFQLTSHFNAVMWWAFPAALLAFEVMVERRAGRPWGWPAAGLAAVTLTVAISGEFHHPVPDRAARVSGRVDLGGGLAGRRGVPWGRWPRSATLGVACAYVLLVFQAVFKGSVAGENGSRQQVVLYPGLGLGDGPQGLRHPGRGADLRRLAGARAGRGSAWSRSWPGGPRWPTPSWPCPW